MKNKTDIIPDSLPTMGFIELRNVEYGGIRDSHGKIF